MAHGTAYVCMYVLLGNIYRQWEVRTRRSLGRRVVCLVFDLVLHSYYGFNGSGQFPWARPLVSIFWAWVFDPGVVTGRDGL